MPTKGFVTVEDYSNEKSTVNFWLQDIGAGNYASVTQDLDEIKDGILGFTLGTVQVAGFSKQFPESSADVTDPSAQRERKALVSYQDTTQFLDVGNTIANPGYLKYFTMEIPAARVYEDDGTTPLLQPNSDEYDLSTVATAALVAALEPNIRTPYNNSANAPTQQIVKITLIGKNI